jgi:DNA-binding Xre family transcriptional regulator
MLKLSLNKEQKIFIKDIKLLNDKRDFVQKLVFESLIRNSKNKKIIAALHVRAGKTRVSKLLIEGLNNNFTGKHLIICPTNIIKDEFKKFLSESNISNVIISTYSGIFSNKFNREEEFLSIIYDEADFGVSSNKSILWTKCLDLKSRWKMCLSGTFEYDNLKLLENKGFDTMFTIDIDDGVLIGTLPSFDVYNLGVELTVEEKKKYTLLISKSEEILKPYRQLFPVGNTAEYAISTITFGKQYIKIGDDVATGDEWMQILMIHTKWQAGVLLGRKKNYNLYRTKMDDIVESSTNKLKTINKIVEKFNNNKGIIFTTRTETCDTLESSNNNIISYHAKSKEKDILDLFRTNVKRVIVSVNKLSRGFTESGIDYAINSNYNSKQNNYTQKIGRALSMSEETIDKNPFIVNLYCKEYTENDIQIIPKDFKRLKKAQEGMLVDWIEEIEQITC